MRRSLRFVKSWLGRIGLSTRAANPEVGSGEWSQRRLAGQALRHSHVSGTTSLFEPTARRRSPISETYSRHISGHAGDLAQPTGLLGRILAVNRTRRL
jgi:hypothetical protein